MQNLHFAVKKNKDIYGVDFGNDYDKRPVENVTWFDAVYFCNEKSKKEGLDPAYKIEILDVEDNHITVAKVELDMNKNGYRLPTVAEWEYAARGADPSSAAWDYIFSGTDSNGQDYSNYRGPDFDSALDEVAWYAYNNKSGLTKPYDEDGQLIKFFTLMSDPKNKGTHEVGQKKANSLGLYDMTGNVGEWCSDWLDRETGKTSLKNTSPYYTYHAECGGSWYYSAFYLPVCIQITSPSETQSDSTGFRLARTSF